MNSFKCIFVKGLHLFSRTKLHTPLFRIGDHIPFQQNNFNYHQNKFIFQGLTQKMVKSIHSEKRNDNNGKENREDNYQIEEKLKKEKINPKKKDPKLPYWLINIIVYGYFGIIAFGFIYYFLQHLSLFIVSTIFL